MGKDFGENRQDGAKRDGWRNPCVARGCMGGVARVWRVYGAYVD